MTNKFETTDLNKETFSLQELLESAAKHAASLENANYSEEEFVAKFEGVVNYALLEALRLGKTRGREEVILTMLGGKTPDDTSL